MMGGGDFRPSKMRAWEPRKQFSDLPTNRAMIRIVRHDQTERLVSHKICEYLACSAIMNVLVVECSGGNSRPSCPSGVGGGTLGNRKISSSGAGQIPNRRRRRSDTPSTRSKILIARQRRYPEVRLCRGRVRRACSTCGILRRPDHGSEVPICCLTMLASRRSMLPLASISARKLFSSVVWP